MKNQKEPRLCPYHEWEILDYCVKAGYLVTDIKEKHILEIRGLKIKQDLVLTNHDPFDRMLIARAKSEKYVLLSHDRNFRYYDEDCIRSI